MFSSNQVFKISGEFEQLAPALEFARELLGYKYPSFRAAARMTPCCNLSFIPAYPDLQDDADHPRCSATG